MIAIGKVNNRTELTIGDLQLSLPAMRQHWMATSTKLEAEQTTPKLAAIRGSNVVAQPLKFNFPHAFDGKKPAQKKTAIKAAVIREKGSNSWGSNSAKINNLVHQARMFGSDLEEHGICRLSTDSKHSKTKRDFGPFFLLYYEKNYFNLIFYSIGKLCRLG